MDVNWDTRVITVYQTDLTLVTGTLYELDTEWFREKLREEEASVEGMPYPKTHTHYTQVTVVGDTYARFIIIENGYSVTFEDGQYTVKLVGSNNNIFDVQGGILNQNQVQVIPTNAAGLIVKEVGSGVTPQDKIDIIEGVWDEVLTGASHNLPTSAGRRLRALSSTVITEGLAQSSTVNTITLNGDALTTDGAYDPAMIAIVEGTGAGQCRNIYEYDGTSRVAVVDRNWKTQPDGTSYYIIYADAGREHVNEGLAQGGTATTIVLNALASSSNDAYKGQTVFIRSGTGEDQSRLIVAYDGTTKVATLETGCDWDVVPDSTSAYVILPLHVHTLPSIANEVWSYER